jgi:hypothetical protein
MLILNENLFNYAYITKFLNLTIFYSQCKLVNRKICIHVGRKTDKIDFFSFIKFCLCYSARIFFRPVKKKLFIIIREVSKETPGISSFLKNTNI